MFFNGIMAFASSGHDELMFFNGIMAFASSGHKIYLHVISGLLGLLQI